MTYEYSFNNINGDVLTWRDYAIYNTDTGLNSYSAFYQFSYLLILYDQIFCPKSPLWGSPRVGMADI